jgi:hypothetical protein
MHRAAQIKPGPVFLKGSPFTKGLRKNIFAQLRLTIPVDLFSIPTTDH